MPLRTPSSISPRPSPLALSPSKSHPDHPYLSFRPPTCHSDRREETKVHRPQPACPCIHRPNPHQKTLLEAPCPMPFRHPYLPFQAPPPVIPTEGRNLKSTAANPLAPAFVTPTPMKRPCPFHWRGNRANPECYHVPGNSLQANPILDRIPPVFPAQAGIQNPFSADTPVSKAAL